MLALRPDEVGDLPASTHVCLAGSKLSIYNNDLLVRLMQYRFPKCIPWNDPVWAVGIGLCLGRDQSIVILAWPLGLRLYRQ